MNDTDVSYKSLVQGADKSDNSHGWLKVKAGADFIESQPCLFVKSIDKPKRQITALASTGSLDRDEEVIEPEAFRELLPVYMKNPVVITSHQHRLQSGSSSVIGNVVKAWIRCTGSLGNHRICRRYGLRRGILAALFSEKTASPVSWFYSD